MKTKVQFWNARQLTFALLAINVAVLLYVSLSDLLGGSLGVLLTEMFRGTSSGFRAHARLRQILPLVVVVERHVGRARLEAPRERS